MASKFKFYISLYFAALFANLGIYLPFMPVWLSWQGMTAFEIAILTSVPLFVRVIAAPFIGGWSDAQGDHRKAIILGSWLMVASAGLLAMASGFWTILFVVMVMQLASQSLIPLVEAKSLRAVHRLGIDYGRMRLWGSLTFIGANIIGGLIITDYGAGSVAAMILLTAMVTALAAHALPADDRGKRMGMHNAETGISYAAVLLQDRWFILLIIASGLIQGSHAMYYVFSALHWRSIGISDTWIGVLWALGVIAEVAFWIVSKHAFARFGALILMITGGVAAVIRWSVMAFEPPFWMLFPIQCLHALTFAATHLGAVRLIETRVPIERGGVAQSAHAALASGAIMGTVTLLSGIIYQHWGVLGYITMAVLSMVGLACAIGSTHSRITGNKENCQSGQPDKSIGS